MSDVKFSIEMGVTLFRSHFRIVDVCPSQRANFPAIWSLKSNVFNLRIFHKKKQWLSVFSDFLDQFLKRLRIQRETLFGADFFNIFAEANAQLDIKEINRAEEN